MDRLPPLLSLGGDFLILHTSAKAASMLHILHFGNPSKWEQIILFKNQDEGFDISQRYKPLCSLVRDFWSRAGGALFKYIHQLINSFILLFSLSAHFLLTRIRAPVEYYIVCCDLWETGPYTSRLKNQENRPKKLSILYKGMSFKWFFKNNFQ